MKTTQALGRLRQDNEGHWYLIPNLYFRTFDVLVAKIDKLDAESKGVQSQKVIEELETLFNRYRLDGGPFDLDVIIKE